MTTEAALPTEAMIVVGMEAMSCLRQTDEYKRMTGCQQGAESARVCWAAMVAEMHSGQPRQDRLPSDSEVLTAWAESHWATYDEDPAGVVKFARLLLQRYEQAVLQSPEIQKMKVDRDVLRGAVRILSFAIEEISEDAGVDLNRAMICLLDAETGEETCNPVPARRFIDGFRQVYGAKT